MGHREGHQVAQTSMKVVWLKVQDPVVLNSSGGGHCLHLADDAVHWIPSQLWLEGGEQVAPGVQGRRPVLSSQPVTVAGVNELLKLKEL